MRVRTVGSRGCVLVELEQKQRGRVSWGVAWRGSHGHPCKNELCETRDVEQYFFPPIEIKRDMFRNIDDLCRVIIAILYRVSSSI